MLFSSSLGIGRIRRLLEGVVNLNKNGLKGKQLQVVAVVVNEWRGAQLRPVISPPKTREL